MSRRYSRRTCSNLISVSELALQTQVVLLQGEHLEFHFFEFTVTDQQFRLEIAELMTLSISHCLRSVRFLESV